MTRIIGLLLVVLPCCLAQADEVATPVKTPVATEVKTQIEAVKTAVAVNKDPVKAIVDVVRAPIDVCKLRIVPGPCRGSFPRWGYNSVTGQCQFFIYGGCQGNGNRFLSKALCEDVCKRKNVCVLPPVQGPCLAYFPRWYYNPSATQCLPFIYGGCGGNLNNFVSKAACEKRCKKPIKGDCGKCDLINRFQFIKDFDAEECCFYWGISSRCEGCCKSRAKVIWKPGGTPDFRKDCDCCRPRGPYIRRLTYRFCYHGPNINPADVCQLYPFNPPHWSCKPDYVYAIPRRCNCQDCIRKLNPGVLSDLPIKDPLPARDMVIAEAKRIVEEKRVAAYSAFAA